MSKKTTQYRVVCVLWEDHTKYSREVLAHIKIKEALLPTMSFGFIYKETDKVIVLVSNMERYGDRDETDVLVILKGGIVSIKDYGTIEIKNIH